MSASDLARAADVSAGVVRGLADQNALRPVLLPGEEPLPVPDAGRAGHSLSADQQAVADALCARVHEGFGVDLIDGVTGSGKTEVYFEAIAAALRAGRQVLVLVPEIALTTQWLERFEARFGAPPPNGIPSWVAPAAAASGARSPTGGRGWSSARARHCFCLIATWA